MAETASFEITGFEDGLRSRLLAKIWHLDNVPHRSWPIERIEATRTHELIAVLKRRGRWLKFCETFDYSPTDPLTPTDSYL